MQPHHRSALVAAALFLFVGSTLHAADPDPTNLQLWLKADAITGLNDNDPVALWPDSSPNGNNATQSNPADRPTWSGPGGSGFGGKPSVTFQGEFGFSLGDGLVTTNPLPGGANLTVFIVLDVLENNGERGILRNRDDFGGFILNDSKNAHENEFAFSKPGKQLFAGSTLGSVPAQILSMRADGTNTAMWSNGGLLISEADTDPVGTSADPLKIGINIGDSDFWGSIAEILIYNTGLTDPQRQAVDSYLGEKYGIAVPTIPEPSSLAAVACGSALLVAGRKRRRGAQANSLTRG